jgi:hypothetical protein
MFFFSAEKIEISKIVVVSHPVEETSCWFIINTWLKHISLYTTRESAFNCRGKRLAFSIFIYIATENNLNFLEKRNLESWACWSFAILFVEFFHTSIRYQMPLYILVENFTAHLLMQNLEQRVETIWRKIKNKIWLISSGPPVKYTNVNGFFLNLNERSHISSSTPFFLVLNDFWWVLRSDTRPDQKKVL